MGDSAQTNSALLRCGQITQPVALLGCAELHPYLSAIYRDLSITPVEPGSAHVPEIIVSKTNSGYARESRWLARPAVFRSKVDTVCDLTVDLTHAMVAASPGSLCLHCGAVRLAQGLFIFPSTYRSGKSVLTIYLTYLGGELFTDDALLVRKDDNHGVVLGLLPRLRLPLPESVSPSFQQFVNERGFVRNKRYCYLRLNEQEMATAGTTAPIAGIVLLHRSKARAPRLEAVEQGQAVKEMILRNFARNNPAVHIVDRVVSIVQAAQCYRLSYDNVDHAARMLIERFNT